MSAEVINLHACAFRINDLGILCVGPSGSGKSELTFSILAEAARWGADTALIADDQIFLSFDHQTIVARRPQATASLIELRGSGIISLKSEESVILTHVITRELSNGNERLPPDNERFLMSNTHELPLIRIPPHSLTPYAKFSAFVEHLCKQGAFAP